MSRNQKVGGDERWLHLFLAIGVFWGCSFLFIEQALKFLNPVGVSFLRCLCGATTIWIIVLIKKIKIPRDRKLWMHVFALALMTNVIPGTLIAIFLLFVTGVLPFLAAVTGSPFGLIAFGLIVLSRITAALRTGGLPNTALLHPVAITFLIGLIIYSWFGKVTKTLTWRQRLVA